MSPVFGVYNFIGFVDVRLAGKREPRDRFAVEQDLQIVRLVVPRNVVQRCRAPASPETDVLGILREMMPDQRAAARAERQPLEMPLLRKVGRQVIDLRQLGGTAELPTAARLILRAAAR